MQRLTNYLRNPTEEQQLLQCLAQGEINAFWHLFEQYRDYLLRCCLKWTNGNLTAAEDLLSQAMLKALEKAQKYAGKIDNFKSWVTTLTRNFWLDLKRRPCANQVEDIEVYAEQEDLEWFAVDDTPESALERDDKNRVIRAAIDELPTKMRETFILHFYEELSHQEIAERQGISYANVCKRISQARDILRPKLWSYFIGDADTKSNTTKVAAKPVKSQKSRKKVVKVEADLPETEQFDACVNKKLEAIESNGEADPTSDLIQDRGASIAGASIAPLPIPGLGDKFGQDKPLFHVRRGASIAPPKLAPLTHNSIGTHNPGKSKPDHENAKGANRLARA